MPGFAEVSTDNLYILYAKDSKLQILVVCAPMPIYDHPDLFLLNCDTSVTSGNQFRTEVLKNIHVLKKNIHMF